MTAPADAVARAQALDLTRHVIALAPAGSGKTSLLVQRLLAALATIEAPEQVVAITFTNKAAAEIRNRAVALLARAAAGTAARDDYDAINLERAHAALQRARGIGWDPAAEPQRLRASTIDAFNAQIAADAPLFSGLGGAARVGEDADGLYRQALLWLFDAALGTGAASELATALAPVLRGAGNRYDRLLPPLAGLLARREQWAARLLGDDWSPQRDAEVLAALHVDRLQALHDVLGADARRRLVQAAATAADGDGRLTWTADSRDWPECEPEYTPLHRALAGLLITAQAKLRDPGRGIDKRLGFAPGNPGKPLLQALLTDLQGRDDVAAAAAAVRALPPATLPPQLAALRDALRTLLNHALAYLRLTMAARGEIDFTEIALAATTALDAAGSDALLRRDLQIRHLLVDEMQDTSELQSRLLQRLTADWQPGDGRSLFMVGDPQQSIYAFRKAEVRLFLQLWHQRRLGALELKPVLLASNFRSAPALVDWFNGAFARIFPPADEVYAGRVAYRPAVAAAGGDGAVAIHAGIDAQAEAAAVVERLRRLPAGGSVAILARARTHLPAVLAALRQAGLAYACQDVDPLAGSPVVRDLRACAYALWHPQDSLHWSVLLRAPWVGFSWADLLALSRGRRDWPWRRRLREADRQQLSAAGRERLARLLRALDQLETEMPQRGLADRVSALWYSLGGPACVDAGGWADAQRLLELLAVHAPGDGLGDVETLERAIQALFASAADGRIQVMTIHKAKGLEFDHVLLVGCGRKPPDDHKPLLLLAETPHGALLLPQPPAHWPDDQRAEADALFDALHQLNRDARRAEGLRLLYVAVTRARRSLDLFVSLPPRQDGSFQPPAHSFAAQLWPLIGDGFAPAAPAASVPAAAVGPPLAPRLPADHAAPQAQALYIPRRTRTLRPSEAVLSAAETRREAFDDEAEDGVYARLIGTLFHQAMARLARAGLAAWQDGGARWRQPLAAGFRRLGLPEPRIETAVARVVTLVDCVTRSERGRWLLGPHPWSAAEYALAGWRDGEWVAAVIDRCFEDENKRLWVIDYKVSAATPGDPEIWRESCRQRYAGQLAAYAALLAQSRGATEVRSALYLPEFGQLVELPAAAPQSPAPAGS
ncbi:MAG: UvrD-helicase domain-containing protein [Gammaproteobacteria bacterium]|nr:UvrD-helicase domain-containing protein [Gammaproteobacteria bacterium]